jgi:hypothetical protein
MEIKDALRSLRRDEWPTLEAKICPEVQAALTVYVDTFLERERLEDLVDSIEYNGPQTSDMKVLEAYWAETSHVRKSATASLVDQLKAFRALNIAMYGDHPELWEEDPATTAEYCEYIDSDGEAYED